MTPTPSEIRTAAKVLRWCAMLEDEYRYNLPLLAKWWRKIHFESMEEIRRKSYVLDEMADEIESKAKP